jgi:ABC-2 type transport system permease protein
VLATKMKKYLKTYKTLLSLNLQSLTAYKINFINSIIASAVWGIVAFIGIYILANKSGGVLGWTAIDMLILTAGYNIITGLFHTIFSRNFDLLSYSLSHGEFDALLLKPLDSQFSISLWLFNYASIFRIILGTVLLAILLNINAISLLSMLPFFMVLIVFSVILMYSLWLIAVSILLKFSSLSNFVGLLYEVMGFSRYPNDIYNNLGALGFSILIPLTIIITVPAKYLTHKIAIIDIVMLIGLTFLFFVFSRTVWKFALRFYTSASG